MKLWQLKDPRGGRFAVAGGRGKWSDPPSRRVQPLIVEWEPGSDLIGDFTWSGLGIVVTERVGKMLLERFSGFELGPVEMIQNPKLKRPQRTTRRTRPRIWLPYQGPPLYELWVTAWVDADLQRSTLEARGLHPDFGHMCYQVHGVEQVDVCWDREALKGHVVRTPREPGKGVYVAEGALRGIDIFNLAQLPGLDHCTDRVRDFIFEQQFTNVDFLEMGEAF
jgi:hypothetical protein